MSIPASAIVEVNPGLLVPGGTDLELNGLFAYDTPLIPPGAVWAFASAEDAKAVFPPDADILAPISIYFRGYNNSPIKPRALFIARWTAEATPPYVIGVKHLSLVELKAVSDGELTLTMGGESETISDLDFSAATSFSDIAAIVQAAMIAAASADPFWLASVCTYDGVSKRFTIGSSHKATEGVIAVPTGDAALALGLASGMPFQGALAQSPTACMDAVKRVTTNWVTFTSGKVTSIPTEPEQLEFAKWSSDQGVRHLYVLYEDNPNLIEQGNTDNIGRQIQDLDLSGVAGEYGEIEYAAFLMGVAASIDYNRPDGAITTAFKAQDGIVFNVTDEATANQLTENGFNYYGDWATANDQFKFHYPGQMFGRYLWVDTYLNAIWLNNALQVSLMSGLSSVGRSPHNAKGYALVRAWMLDPILRALSAGIIDTGITLSESQKAEIAAQAGMDISSQLQTSGYFIQILDPGAVARKDRQSPIINFWYTYGGSIQKLVVASRAIV
ncbi:DUF3383 domain-containing protein [Pseudomonas sp. NPDC098747]|uniref:DUF3383 domain-containing protein n=1 Tax=Pseudomonas sp. NPDC098747 TaxID=3364487 RepID=UPI00383A9608